MARNARNSATGAGSGGGTSFIPSENRLSKMELLEKQEDVPCPLYWFKRENGSVFFLVGRPGNAARSVDGRIYGVEGKGTPADFDKHADADLPPAVKKAIKSAPKRATESVFDYM